MKSTEVLLRDDADLFEKKKKRARKTKEAAAARNAEEAIRIAELKRAIALKKAEAARKAEDAARRAEESSVKKAEAARKAEDAARKAELKRDAAVNRIEAIITAKAAREAQKAQRAAEAQKAREERKAARKAEAERKLREDLANVESVLINGGTTTDGRAICALLDKHNIVLYKRIQRQIKENLVVCTVDGNNVTVEFEGIPESEVLGIRMGLILQSIKRRIRKEGKYV